MADPADKNIQTVNVADLDVKDIIVQLHNTAVEKISSSLPVGYIIQNSAIDVKDGDKTGKSAKFYGAGSHIIAAIPKETKGLDKNKIDKTDALNLIKTYVQWFSGPDVANNISLEKLLPLEGDNNGKTQDTSDKKEDNEKSRGGDAEKSTISKEKYQESIDDLPSFSDWLILEAGEEDANINQASQGADGSQEKNEEATAGTTSGESAPGYYIIYKMEIEGQPEHPLKDAFEKTIGNFVKGIGISFEDWRSGATTSTHTIGGLVDEIDAVFGKIDPDELSTEYNKNLQKKFPKGDAKAEVWDTKTILQYLKKDLASGDKQKIQEAQFAVCTRVDKRDKSYKLYNPQAIADILTSSIKGLVKMFKNKITKDQVIMVNNYSDNKKEDAEQKNYQDTDRAEGSVADSQSFRHSGSLLVEEMLPVKTRFEQLKKTLADQATKQLKDYSPETDIDLSDKIIDKLKSVGIDEAQLFDKLKGAKHSFLVKTVEKKAPADKDERVNASMMSSLNSLQSLLFEAANEDKDLKSKVEKVFLDTIATHSKDWLGKNTDVKNAAVQGLEGYVAEKLKQEKFHAIYSFMKLLYDDCSMSEAQDLLCEGHCEEWTDLMKEVNEIGADAFNIRGKKDKKTKKRGPDAAEKLRAAYEKHLVDAKKNKKYVNSDYTKKIDTSSKNWVNKMLISSLHADPENPLTTSKLVSKFEEAFKGKNRDTSDERPEIYALLQALKDVKKDLPKPASEEPKKDTEPGTKKDTGSEVKTDNTKDHDPEPVPPEIEEFEYKFFDYDPENPDDDDPKELKTGKVQKGGNITPPPAPKHEKFEFIGWKPDEFDGVEKPMTYISQYAKAKPSIFPVVFYDFDFDAGTAVAIDTQYIENGKAATEPTTPDHEDIGWKFTGWDTKFDKITGPLNVMAEYRNIVTIQPKVPKDPEKPTEGLEDLGDLIVLDPEKTVKEQLPELPEKDGYEPDGWEPDPDKFDPSEVENPKDPVEFIGKYKKTADSSKDDKQDEEVTYWVIPDENGLLDGFMIQFFMPDPEDPDDKKKWKAFDDNTPSNDPETVKKNWPTIDELNEKLPKGSGVVVDKEKPWTRTEDEIADLIDGTSPAKDDELSNGSDGREIIAIRPNFKKAVPMQFFMPDPKSPNDKSLWKPLDGSEPVNDYDELEKSWPKDDDIKRQLPEGKDFGGWKPAPEIVKKISNGEQTPDPDDLTDDNVLAIRPIFTQNSFKIKVVSTDPEDPDNTKTQEEIATINIVDGKYKVGDLQAAAKQRLADGAKEKGEELSRAAKENQAAFKNVDNIQAINDKHRPYELLGWTTDKNNDPTKPEFKKSTIEDVIAEVTERGIDDDEEVVLKTVWKNDIKAKHTNLDFYIVPMRGLKRKSEKSDAK